MSTEQKAAIAATLESLKLSAEAVFVPFSKSRNKGEENKTLNWRVTIKRDGRDVLSFDYSAGIGHCPGYACAKAPATFRPHHYRNASGNHYPGTSSQFRSAKPHEVLSQYIDAVCAAECESGFPMVLDHLAHPSGNMFRPKSKGAPIMPEIIDIFYCLAMDSDVLNFGDFEDWADECGYDSDSKKAESLYRECLEQALKMRAAIGEAGLVALTNAFEDY